MLLRPPRWSNGGGASLVTSDDAPNLTDNPDLNLTVEDLKNNFIHVKIDVTATTTTTYINKVLVDQQEFPSTESVTPSIDSIGFRASNTTVDGVHGNEDFWVDTLKVTDYTNDSTIGDAIYDYNFDRGINPFPQGSIENGVLHVGNNVDVFVTNDKRIPTFRHEFTMDTASHGDITSARLYSTALGVYDMWINGQRVGVLQEDGSYDELKPGYTQTPKDRITQIRRHYYTYDVTQLLGNGPNAISASVSPGWWRGGVAFNSATTIAFRAKLMIQYADGYTQWINTNTEDWMASERVSPIMSAGTGIWDGEAYDATTDLSWRYPGYVYNSNWSKPVVNTEFPSDGVLQAIPGGKVRVRDDLERPMQSAIVYNGATGATDEQYGKINVIGEYEEGQSFSLNPGETVVVDFGQNAAGWTEIQVEGPKRIPLLKSSMEKC